MNPAVIEFNQVFFSDGEIENTAQLIFLLRRIANIISNNDQRVIIESYLIVNVHKIVLVSCFEEIVRQ